MGMIKITRLPQCTLRKGRMYDHKSVMTCGFREIEPDECIDCNGFPNTYLIAKIKSKDI